ncbi:MAG TPA: alpha/beta hydrolase [Pseudonocardiaceae bacterium]|jgi:pimeloyl-ACP methyl ester carboxylesterase|nr:alpha/beta hydrolase [Pseudonocardiaceae bacterium]
MPTFSAQDGTRLAYRVVGDGDPLVCVPGGPTDAGYLGDLGGLSRHHRLILLDPRGTGGSATPDDTSSYRCDRMVDDIDALREHLALDRIDLLGHSAGANIATRYAARYPRNVGRLLLVGPGTRAVGIAITGEMRSELALLRKDEPWFPAAFAALTAIAERTGRAASGRAWVSSSDWDAVAPFFHGRWDAETQRHHAASQPTNKEAVAIFGADGAFDPDATREALAAADFPVLLLTGEFDMNSPPRSTAEFAELFRHATLAVQPGAGHYPWLDDPERFVAAVAAFLD